VVTRKILDSSWYSTAQNLCVYLNMPHGELRTDDLVKHALENGKVGLRERYFAFGMDADLAHRTSMCRTAAFQTRNT
jgi:hypothetical protein